MQLFYIPIQIEYTFVIYILQMNRKDFVKALRGEKLRAKNGYISRRKIITLLLQN